MMVKVFGKALFEVKKSGVDFLLTSSSDETKKSKFLPDFFKGFNDTNSGFTEFVTIGGDVFTKKGQKKKAPAVKVKEITPKDAYELKLLNDRSFSIKTDPAYVDKQLEMFKDKLALISSEEYDMRNGVKEIGSIVLRLENRKKYGEHAEFYEEFPYTTSSRIDGMIKAHPYLKIGQVAQFLADMPKEASDVMKAYNKETKALCDKQAVFYIIANKKDFEKTQKRRDPILLAQSPFGHFWQILGAWDEEMLLVEEL